MAERNFLARVDAIRKDLAALVVESAKETLRRAIHDGWHEGKMVHHPAASTFADGLATRSCYELTFDALRAGLKDFVTVTDNEIAGAIRLFLEHTHNLAEGAGAAGLAGLLKLAPRLSGKRVGVILSGGNIDAPILRRVLDGTIQ